VTHTKHLELGHTPCVAANTWLLLPPHSYPFDIPSEAFTFLRFKQAFAAIQASVVHLQVGGG
jgi:hypothetical protein